MTTCRYFERLKLQIRDECSRNGVDQKAQTYLINKVSRAIKRSEFDIYEVYVSLKGYPEIRGYCSHLKVDYHSGSLYVTFVID